MRRIINTKLTAALALSGVLHRLNEAVIQLGLEQDLDGITQVCAELIDTSFQLQSDTSKLEQMGSFVSRADQMVQECRLNQSGLIMWQRMHRAAKLEAIKAMVHEAKSLVMAYSVLPVQMERKRRPATFSAHPPATVSASGQVATSAL